MDKQNSIYAFFVLLALLFWNPLTFHFLYSDSPAFTSKPIHWFYWAVLAAGMLTLLLLRKNRVFTWIKDAWLYFSFFTILFALLVLVNTLITPKSETLAKGIIFDPGSNARYDTPEFDFTLQANSLGLRNREIAVEKGDKFRILCFGDSWTLGWGVADEYTYPSRLEQYLKANGLPNVEVINCGQGGQYTAVYKTHMMKALPLLKPDLVLVGVLQGDDLAQSFEEHFDSLSLKRMLGISATQQFMFDVRAYIKSSIGNVIAPITKKATHQVEIKDYWKQSAQYKLSQYNHLQNIRFQSLDDSLQHMFTNGGINPGLMTYYIDYPERYFVFNDPTHKATRFAFNAMDQDIREMKEMCDQFKCPMVFINMPINYFNGHHCIRTPLDNLNVYLRENNRIDSMYSAIAQRNGLPYIELTEHFLQLEDKVKYHFIYDGHPNELGYGEIAQYIGRQLQEKNLVTQQLSLTGLK